MPRLFWIVAGLAGIALVVFLALAAGPSSDGDRYVSGFILAVWGVVIAAGLVGSGLRFGAIARNLGLWMLVALVLVAGYQYRYELQDVGSRLTAGLIPGSPLSVTDSDGRSSVQLDRLPNGHFEARASVDGVPVQFMVDTGATTTVLAFDDARRAGIDVEALSFFIPVATANGQGRAARATIRTLEVGTIERRNMPVLVAEDGRLGQSLLGMSFIGSLSGFDMRGDRMILRD